MGHRAGGHNRSVLRAATSTARSFLRRPSRPQAGPSNSWISCRLETVGADLVRLVRGVRGRVDLRTEFILRFDYGSIVPWVESLEEGGLRAVAGPEMAVLRTPVSLDSRDFTTVGEFTVGAGDVMPFVLSYGPSQLPPPQTIDPERALRETCAFWHSWSNRCAPAGRWSETVKHSLTVLKGLTYAPTGGIIAAPTTSLPEQAGGVRNWDYRYCWLRDATFTLLALGTAGYYEEARDWRDWLLRAVAGSPDQLQIMYGVGGERRLPEWEVPWLSGFEERASRAHRQCSRWPASTRRLRRDRGRDVPGSRAWPAVSRPLVGNRTGFPRSS